LRADAALLRKESIVLQPPLGKLALAVLAVAGLTGATGCQVSGSGSAGGRSRVVDRQQNQTVTPDGAAVRTRTQVRETNDGTTVRETQTERREPVSPGTGAGSGTSR
jgi:hypothetical protein